MKKLISKIKLCEDGIKTNQRIITVIAERLKRGKSTLYDTKALENCKDRIRGLNNDIARCNYYINDIETTREANKS